MNIHIHIRIIYFFCTLTLTYSLSQSFKNDLKGRRRFLQVVISNTAVFGVLTANKRVAMADLNSASANGIPLVGRFEQLKGANSFIGNWQYQATKGISQGELAFLKNGEVELRSGGESSTIIAVGAVPWKYVSPKGSDKNITVTFTLDQDGQDDVLIFEGTIDLAIGADRIMEGSISTGRAEIGARGGGPMKQVGSFKANFIQ